MYAYLFSPEEASVLLLAHLCPDHQLPVRVLVAWSWNLSLKKWKKKRRKQALGMRRGRSGLLTGWMHVELLAPRSSSDFVKRFGKRVSWTQIGNSSVEIQDRLALFLFPKSFFFRLGCLSKMWFVRPAHVRVCISQCTDAMLDIPTLILWCRHGGFADVEI